MTIEKFAVSIGIFAAGIALAFPPSFATAHNGVVHPPEEGSTTIHVMKHLCNDTIKNRADFQRIQKGLDPVAALAATVLACPTTALPGDQAVAGTVASTRTQYNFSIRGAGSMSQNMAEDGVYMQHKLCESDLNLDANGDGQISSKVCLDISHYSVSGIESKNGIVAVKEFDAPEGFKFGTLKFTPSAIDGNNDAESLRKINRGQGRIELDVSNDKDNTIMLHIYNFQK
jgi:hypothetical protein